MIIDLLTGCLKGFLEASLGLHLISKRHYYKSWTFKQTSSRCGLLILSIHIVNVSVTSTFHEFVCSDAVNGIGTYRRIIKLIGKINISLLHHSLLYLKPPPGLYS